MINDNQLEVPCIGSIKSGDSVMIVTRNGEPTAIAAAGWGDSMSESVEAAAQTATEAAAVAAATNQHFTFDANGAHVSTAVTTDQQGNTVADLTTGSVQTLGSQGNLQMLDGKLLRSDTASGTSFYDGTVPPTDQDLARHIVASFNAGGAQVGMTTAPHLRMTSAGIVGYDSNSTPFFVIDSNGSRNVADIVREKRWVSDSDFGGTLSGGGEVVVASIDVSGLPSGTSTVPIDGLRFEVGVPSASINAGGIQRDGLLEAYSPSQRPYISPGYKIIATKQASASFAVGVSSAMYVSVPLDTYTMVLRARYDAQAETVELSYEMTGEWDEENPFEFDCWVKASWTSVTYSPSFTLGTRFGAPGSYSYALGEGLYAEGDNQAALGRWNVRDSQGEYALIVGNGSDDANRSDALTVDWSGNVECGTVNGVDFAAIGAVEPSTSSSVEVPTGTNVNVSSVTLDAGVWTVDARVSFPSNSTGRRAIKLSTTSQESGNVVSTVVQNTVSGATTQMSTSRTFSLQSRSTVYLVAWQNSGGDLTCSGTMEATRVSPSLGSARDAPAWGYATEAAQVTLATTETKMTFSSFDGKDAELDSGGVKVAQAGWYEVSGSVEFRTNFTANDICHIVVKKNGTENISHALWRMYNANPYCTVTLPPFAAELSAGDVLHLYAYNQGGARGIARCQENQGNGLLVKRLG